MGDCIPGDLVQGIPPRASSFRSDHLGSPEPGWRALFGPLLMPVSYLISLHCFVNSDVWFVPNPQHRQASVPVAT
jgi:hypothetical protein